MRRDGAGGFNLGCVWVGLDGDEGSAKKALWMDRYAHYHHDLRSSDKIAFSASCGDESDDLAKARFASLKVLGFLGLATTVAGLLRAKPLLAAQERHGRSARFRE